jgi:hypothetical protein
MEDIMALVYQYQFILDTLVSIQKDVLYLFQLIKSLFTIYNEKY